jgi:hypothetical protein
MIRHSQLQPQLQTNLICATLPNKNRITGLPKREGEREGKRGRKIGRGRGRELTIKIPSKLPGRDQLASYQKKNSRLNS